MEKGYQSNNRKQLPKYLEKTEIESILAIAKKHRYRDYIILLTLWRTGIRNSELVNLKKKDIMESTLIVRNGKGHKDRVVPLEKELGRSTGGNICKFCKRLGM